MNKVILMGRLTRDPEIRYTKGDDSMAVARYTLAVDRRRQGPGLQKETDFISCITFSKNAEFASRYLHQGTKTVVTGRLQTGSYVNKDGQKVYTTDVIVDDQEFAESRIPQDKPQKRPEPTTTEVMGEGFMAIPSDDGGLPFN